MSALRIKEGFKVQLANTYDPDKNYKDIGGDHISMMVLGVSISIVHLIYYIVEKD